MASPSGVGGIEGRGDGSADSAARARGGVILGALRRGFGERLSGLRGLRGHELEVPRLEYTQGVSPAEVTEPADVEAIVARVDSVGGGGLFDAAPEGPAGEGVAVLVELRGEDCLALAAGGDGVSAAAHRGWRSGW